MASEIDFKCPYPQLNCYTARRTDAIYWIDSHCEHHYKLTKNG
jgi:hypothetical protein